ncbi:hypothetical protein [Sphingomonas sp. CROZ-RG-20F-R02-07]|uniref:hypothetical protein n=1 Tax=Sphingomonas sp. CROZ-RG-20F-R02-07 TaxID=2914832 RepID=UPI001F569DB8|nr:hypothetical protein [Sphingomonas sp. CROZ-RG-20F-R02-07]
MKFEAFKEFRRDLTRLRVLYEASTQAYETLHQTGKAIMQQPGHPASVVFKVGAKTIKRPWKSVTFHARDIYPKTLRSVILVQAISIYEVFIVAIVAEMATRSKDWLKDDKRLEMSHAELLTIVWNQGIEAYILDKLMNGLTRGSLSDKLKFYKTKFNVELAASDTAYQDLEEVHDRRNLYVHRMGYPDAFYIRKYPGSTAREDQKIPVDDDYLEQTFAILESSARHIVQKLEALYPQVIAPTYTIGSAPLTVSAQQLHIVTVRCLSNAALAIMRNEARMLVGAVALSDTLVWLAVVGLRVTYVLAGTGETVKPFFKQIASDEKANQIRVEQSFRINRRNIRSSAPSNHSINPLTEGEETSSTTPDGSDRSGLD